ncbi:hypothetical protein M885DRAFT_544359 [Pelagophyceae sp. CCMP2097]|nr:hypothetical protein M885DRAFT_544359 [Pelagophyceae sp. CCMP2097]
MGSSMSAPFEKRRLVPPPEQPAGKQPRRSSSCAPRLASPRGAGEGRPPSPRAAARPRAPRARSCPPKATPRTRAARRSARASAVKDAPLRELDAAEALRWLRTQPFPESVHENELFDVIADANVPGTALSVMTNRELRDVVRIRPFGWRKAVLRVVAARVASDAVRFIEVDGEESPPPLLVHHSIDQLFSLRRDSHLLLPIAASPALVHDTRRLRPPDDGDGDGEDDDAPTAAGTSGPPRDDDGSTAGPRRLRGGGDKTEISPSIARQEGRYAMRRSLTDGIRSFMTFPPVMSRARTESALGSFSDDEDAREPRRASRRACALPGAPPEEPEAPGEHAACTLETAADETAADAARPSSVDDACGASLES